MHLVNPPCLTGHVCTCLTGQVPPECMHLLNRSKSNLSTCTWSSNGTSGTVHPRHIHSTQLHLQCRPRRSHRRHIVETPHESNNNALREVHKCPRSWGLRAMFHSCSAVLVAELCKVLPEMQSIHPVQVLRAHFSCWFSAHNQSNAPAWPPNPP